MCQFKERRKRKKVLLVVGKNAHSKNVHALALLHYMLQNSLIDIN